MGPVSGTDTAAKLQHDIQTPIDAETVLEGLKLDLESIPATQRAALKKQVSVVIDRALRGSSMLAASCDDRLAKILGIVESEITQVYSSYLPCELRENPQVDQLTNQLAKTTLQMPPQAPLRQCLNETISEQLLDKGLAEKAAVLFACAKTDETGIHMGTGRVLREAEVKGDVEALDLMHESLANGLNQCTMAPAAKTEINFNYKPLWTRVSVTIVTDLLEEKFDLSKIPPDQREAFRSELHNAAAREFLVSHARRTLDTASKSDPGNLNNIADRTKPKMEPVYATYVSCEAKVNTPSETDKASLIGFPNEAAMKACSQTKLPSGFGKIGDIDANDVAAVFACQTTDKDGIKAGASYILEHEGVVLGSLVKQRVESAIAACGQKLSTAPTKTGE